MKKQQKILLLSAGIVVGSIAGYLYYVIKGCESGCMIWSSPVLSSLVGSAFGFMFADLIADQLSKKTKP